MRNVLERSSARETAMRVAVGAICKQLLQAVGITIVGYVDQVGSVKGPVVSPLNVAEIEAAITQNDMRMLDDQQVDRIHLLIDETRHAGNTLGGVVRVVANGVPAGLGSYTAWNQKLDAKIAAAVVGVNAIKGVEIGDGFEAAQNLGSEVMDQIDWHEGQGYSRLSDHLGGFEGGMTNGMPIVVRGALKPIPTLYQPCNLSTFTPMKCQKLMWNAQIPQRSCQPRSWLKVRFPLNWQKCYVTPLMMPTWRGCKNKSQTTVQNLMRFRRNHG